MRVVQTRGGIVEGVHPMRAVVVRGGEVVWEAGEPCRSTFRSAAKPMQLLASWEALGLPHVPAEELAIGASSHSGQPFHLALVRRVLARFGASEDGLLCGATPPFHEPSHHALIRAGKSPTPIHSDCSGKHAFMLAACVHNGWSQAYLDPEHPVQLRVREVMTEWCGEEAPFAVDGCGVPTFAPSIAGMARAWARLATSPADSPAGRIREAMAAHPRLTAGDGRLDLLLAQAASEPIAVKIGAMGVFCIAVGDLGIAVKCRTGDIDALSVAVPAVLRAVAPDAWHQPDEWPWAVVRNDVGLPVGERRVEI